MDISIRRERSYYTVYVDNVFYGNYDTVKEAEDDLKEFEDALLRDDRYQE